MERISDVSLMSNGYTLPAARIGRLQSTDPKQSRAALVEQFEAQGYLWLKGILDRDSILAFRARVFEAMRESGLVAPGTAPVDGIYADDETPSPVHPNKILMEMARWAAFEAFCLAEPIWRFYEMLIDPAFLDDNPETSVQFVPPTGNPVIYGSSDRINSDIFSGDIR